MGVVGRSKSSSFHHLSNSQLILDISFKDDVTIIFLLDVSFMFVSRWECQRSMFINQNLVCVCHRLNIKLDLQSIFGLLCTAVLIG